MVLYVYDTVPTKSLYSSRTEMNTKAEKRIHHLIRNDNGRYIDMSNKINYGVCYTCYDYRKEAYLFIQGRTDSNEDVMTLCIAHRKNALRVCNYRII